jgi:hypothetical protein
MGNGTRLEVHEVALATDLAVATEASVAGLAIAASADADSAEASADAVLAALAVAGAVVSVGDLAGAGDGPGVLVGRDLAGVGAGVHTGMTHRGGVLMATTSTPTAAITTTALRMPLRPTQIMGITIPTDRRTHHHRNRTTTRPRRASRYRRPGLRPTL